MDDESRRARIRRLVEAINTQEMEPFDAIYHDCGHRMAAVG
jgi:hypothetical protein